eukprot:TRINITY_DN2362_c0_g1_i1.p1 TRINITY_DN2362_c0_g1~~TRINITY_DN2362_c0_g1_i1.p1  ORF type:complete len:372 (-),score=78.37 TRINITY_DN2362_c0_g1_i1:1077-2192(-)
MEDSASKANETFSKANNLYREQRFNESFPLLQQAAEQDQSEAQFLLATSYREGRGVNQDLDSALYWYKRAAVQGNEVAIMEVAYAYYHGQGVPLNKVESRRWFDLGAEKQIPAALWQGSWLYFSGQGGTKDEKRGIECLKRAAMLETHTSAMQFYGQMTFDGECTEKNEVEGLRWIEKAADMGNSQAKQELAVRMMKKLEITPDSSSPEETKALALLNYAADAADEGAHLQLARYYFNKGDYPRGAKLYEQAIYSSEDASYELAMALLTGKGDLKADSARALELLEEAATEKHLNSQKKLATLYLSGDSTAGIQKDPKKGAKYLVEAAENGDRDCQLLLGYSYLNGTPFLEQNTKKAQYWVQKASKNLPKT